MKFKLHNGEELDLPKKLNFNERVNLINNKILNSKEHEYYYNKNSLRLNYDQIDNIVKRWIGVKKVNVPYPDETLKTSFDILSTYLVYSKDHDVSNEIKDYIDLIFKDKNKDKENNLSKEEENRLNKVKKNVIYYRLFSKSNSKNIVFYINKKYERFLNKRIKELSKIDDYFTFPKGDLEKTINRLENKRSNIKEIKNEIDNLKHQVVDCKKNVSEVKDEIRLLYEELKNNKENPLVVSNIEIKIRELKSLQESIKIKEDYIGKLVDDYKQQTELFI